MSSEMDEYDENPYDNEELQLLERAWDLLKDTRKCQRWSDDIKDAAWNFACVLIHANVDPGRNHAVIEAYGGELDRVVRRQGTQRTSPHVRWIICQKVVFASYLMRDTLGERAFPFQAENWYSGLLRLAEEDAQRSVHAHA